MKKLEYHPASNVFRLMDSEERAEMRASIKQHGQQESIKLWDGQIIDGRNRYLCCQELKIEPWVAVLAKSDLDGMSPLDYVVVMNKHRRHDDVGQRAMAAAKIKQEYEREAAERSQQNLKKGTENPEVAKLPPRETGKSRDRAGEAMGVSGKTVDAAEKVIDNAPKSVVNAVESGEVKVSDAASVADEPKSVQSAALKAVQSGASRTMKAAVKELEQPRKSGKQTIDYRLFEQLESYLGKGLRMIDKLHKVHPAFKFHRDCQARVKEALLELEHWKKAIK